MWQRSFRAPSCQILVRIPKFTVFVSARLVRSEACVMEKTKVSHHPYATRHSKVAKIESITEQTKPYASLSKAAKGDSPASTAKFCMISGYASPPCRPIISSSQTNDHEIEWDLTSPSARKFQQVLLSDKKTSTPNRTPTRGELPKKRELRPRLVLCKKNIALSTSGEVGSDLVDELAALNDLVNTEQANQSTGVMTPPPSVKGRAINDSCNKSFMSDTEVSSKPSIPLHIANISSLLFGINSCLSFYCR